MQNCEIDGQLMLFVLESSEELPAKPLKQKTTAGSMSALVSIPYFHLDLSKGHVDLFGCHYWEFRSPWRENGPPLNTGVAPREPIKRALSEILEANPDRRYYLSRIACLGILRRAKERNKELPPQLKWALMVQAGLIPPDTGGKIPCTAFAANQRDEVRDLHGVAGALGAQPGMKQQTFIAGECLNPWDTQQARVFTPEEKALAGADGGGGRSPAGLLFAAGVVSKGNGDCFLTPERHTSLSGGGGQAGQGYPCVLAAGFCAGAAPTAGGIGYQEETAPTLKAAESGTNMVPSILCLNDQGGQRMDITKDQTATLRAKMGGHQPLICLNDQGGSVMDCTEDITGTLRAQEHGHQPLVFDNHGQDTRFNGPVDSSQTISASFGEGGNNQPLVLATQQGGAEIGVGVCPTITAAAGMSGNNQPVLFENHGIDARYTGPHPVSPTLSARAGTGGNNLPLALQAETTFGTSMEYLDIIAPADHRTVFSRQRVDVFKDDEIASTESARQHKDATDLVHQTQVFGQTQYGNYSAGCATLRAQGGDHGGGSENLVVTEHEQRECLLIRRLTPLECERLQGFPDGWTDIPGASDSSRYKALGNSVAIPCVEYIMRGIAIAVGIVA